MVVDQGEENSSGSTMGASSGGLVGVVCRCR